MNRLFLLSGTVRRDAAVDAWLSVRPAALAAIARHWFNVMRECGDDVREIMHDGHPTACVGDAAFAYVNVFTAHVNAGFFHGAGLADPAQLLQGSGKYMRHVKLKTDEDVDVTALTALIHAAYGDMKARLRAR